MELLATTFSLRRRRPGKERVPTALVTGSVAAMLLVAHVRLDRLPVEAMRQRHHVVAACRVRVVAGVPLVGLGPEHLAREVAVPPASGR